MKPPLRLGLAGLLAAALLAAAVGVRADGDASARWEQLSTPQQRALAPLQPHWGRIDLERRQKWLELAARFPDMSAEERAKVQERMVAWAYLPPAERGRARQQFQQTRQLSVEERHAQWQAYQALSAEQRERWAREAQARGAGPSTAAPLREPRPLAHSFQQPGLPKIATTPEFVEPSTLLPRRGAQGAARSEAPRAANAKPENRPPAAQAAPASSPHKPQPSQR
jgi:hypothetical protein